MNAVDLVRSAVANTFRSKTRTTLTVLAIFVGASTLTLTNGLGTGINAYIDDTVTAVGAQDVMSVTKNSETASEPAEDAGPAEYDPDAVATGGFDAATVSALTPGDLDTLDDVEGVLDVQATKSIAADYIQADGGDQFVLSIGALVEGQSVQLAAGEDLDDAASELQVLIPISYVEPLGFETDDDAVGQTVSIAVTDSDRAQHVIDATVVGVADAALASPAGVSVTTNDALTDALYAAQSTGLSTDETEQYAQASIWFSPDATDDEIAALQERLVDAGFTGTTVADQLGAVTAVIDGIVLVLNAFAIIALLAAGFGIVNTLFMSVQERTREIGLMKAMGMGSGRIFSLFSLEAAFIGFLGSAVGVVIAILVGSVVSSALSGGLLTSLPGLTLIAFDPVSIALIILAVMGIAFLAGTLPAARAARADPVTSLRYE